MHVLFDHIIPGFKIKYDDNHFVGSIHVFLDNKFSHSTLSYICVTKRHLLYDQMTKFKVGLTKKINKATMN